MGLPHRESQLRRFFGRFAASGQRLLRHLPYYLEHCPAGETSHYQKYIYFDLQVIKSIGIVLIFVLFSDAHPQSQITSLDWLDSETIVSTGQDCNTKLWNIPVA